MKHLIILAVFLAIFFRSQATSGQANITSAAARADEIVETNGSSTPNKTEDKTKSQDVSRQASDEAKRLYKLGVKYGRGGLFRQASEVFQKAVQLNPNYADAHFGLGLALFDQGRWQEAIPSFEQALKLNSKDKEAAAKLDEASLLARKAKRASSIEKETSAVPVSRIAAADSRPANDLAAGVPVSLNVSPESQPNNSESAPTAKASELTKVYHIGVGDVLDVRLGDGPATQSTLFTVTPSGLLEHPILAEPLQVSGLTVEETRVRLEADLKRRSVNENPRVLVGVREYLSHAIIVSGLVKEPGTKLLRREAIPLYVVIADAQPAPEAGRATLIRHETGEALVVDLSKPAEMNLLVRSGDVVTVHANPKRFFYVGGQVKAPGEVQFRPGLTLTQAILAAGGLSRESKEAYVAREGDNGFLASTRYKLKDINTGKLADPLIQPGDRITVEH
ncbi:MAG: tetratricopeptide repeat protein [Pyrinomonadaceae bacterium]|jgi:protein involved in polysaccharide export with SLBB domain|nr:tetratricopeptide repeat protein [Pyrinomonadaceae bacterium]